MITKVKSVFLIPLIVLLTVFTLFSTLSASSVSAAAGIVLSSDKGYPGETITISGSFNTVNSGLATITFNDSYMGLVNISSGYFTGTFQVPVLERGTYSVVVQTAGNTESVSTIFIITPHINLSTSAVQVGDEITINGNGFLEGEVFIYLDNSTTVLAETSANESGILDEVTVTVPAANKAIHYFIAADSTGYNNAAYATFSIVPRIILSSTVQEISAGDSLNIIGSGFASSSIITVNLKGTPVNTNPSSIVTDDTGSFTASFAVPATMARGACSIMAIDTAKNFATYVITINEKITLSESRGVIGESITVKGSSFKPNDTISVYFDNEVITNAQTDSNGSFTINLTIPSASQGTYNIKVKDSDNNEAAADFTITPKIVINPISDTIGTLTKVSGYGFSASSDINVYFDDINVAVAKTNSVGSFTVNIDIPVSTSGEHMILAEDDEDNNASAIFITTPKIMLNIDTGVFGDIITITGNGFTAGNAFDNAVTFTVDNTPGLNIEDVYTDLTGSFSVSFTIPGLTNGNHIIKAEDTYGNYSTVELTIKASIVLQNTTTGVIVQSGGYATGVEDDKIQITGYGFKANSTFVVKYGDVMIPTVADSVTTDTKGGFSASFSVPGIVNEIFIVEASDGSNTAYTNFIETIEKDRPAAVSLSSPVNTVKVKQPVVFNWTASNDKNGVIYKLQISTDSAFTNIVLNTGNITTTSYTIAKESKLKSVSEKNPYYWRVMAVDGVGNESDWTTDTFIVGFIWPVWLTYVLIGVLGLVFLIVIGFWLGRKIATGRDDKTYNYDMDTDLEYRYREQYPDANLDHSYR